MRRSEWLTVYPSTVGITIFGVGARKELQLPCFVAFISMAAAGTDGKLGEHFAGTSCEDFLRKGAIGIDGMLYWYDLESRLKWSPESASSNSSSSLYHDDIYDEFKVKHSLL